MNTRAIERLRRRFIAISMVALFVAMFFIGGSIWLSSYIVSRKAISDSLAVIIESDGEQITSYSSDDFMQYPSLRDVFTTSLKDQISFWLIKYDGDGVLTEVKGRYSNETERYLIDMGKAVKGSGHRFGHTGRIYYKVVENDDGTVIAFIDGTNEINALNRLLYIALIVCAEGLIVTYLLVSHFSYIAVNPEVENFRKQNDFITNASHELKTPLAVIRANTEMTQMLNGSDEWSESTLKQVDHMNGLIQNLVLISKAQELEDKTQVSEIDVSDTVEQSVRSFEAVAAKEKVTLERKINPEVRMTADASKIMQLTTILADNAIKYCDEGGKVNIELSQLRRGAVRLVVSNDYRDGENVDCEKFFDRFYREDKSHNIDRGGYGIGLSIAEDICRQYKGSIKASWKNGSISFTCLLY